MKIIIFLFTRNCLTCIAKVPTPPEAPKIKTLQCKNTITSENIKPT